MRDGTGLSTVPLRSGTAVHALLCICSLRSGRVFVGLFCDNGRRAIVRPFIAFGRMLVGLGVG